MVPAVRVPLAGRLPMGLTENQRRDLCGGAGQTVGSRSFAGNL